MYLLDKLDFTAYPLWSGGTCCGAMRLANRRCSSIVRSMPARWKSDKPISRQAFDARFSNEEACAQYGGLMPERTDQRESKKLTVKAG